MKKVFALLVLSALGLAAFLPLIVQGQGQSQQHRPQAEVTQEVKHDVSPPLRDINDHVFENRERKREKPLRLIPQNEANTLQPDAAVQSSSGPLVNTTSGVGIAGVGDGDLGFSPNAAPPDTNAAVGATQVVQWVNESYAVFDKTTGLLLLGPRAGNSIWSGFGGGCEANNDGDPIIQYDKAANRWVFTQFSVSTLPYLQCVAVSTTSDATGGYNRYALSYGNTPFSHHPKPGGLPAAFFLSLHNLNNRTT